MSQIKVLHIDPKLTAVVMPVGSDVHYPNCRLHTIVKFMQTLVKRTSVDVPYYITKNTVL